MPGSLPTMGFRVFARVPLPTWLSQVHDLRNTDSRVTAHPSYDPFPKAGHPEGPHLRDKDRFCGSTTRNLVYRNIILNPSPFPLWKSLSSVHTTGAEESLPFCDCLSALTALSLHHCSFSLEKKSLFYLKDLIDFVPVASKFHLMSLSLTVFCAPPPKNGFLSHI